MSAAVVPAFAVTTEDLTKQRETEHFEFYCTNQDVKASTTMNIYAHALEESDKKAASALETLLEKRA